MSMYVTIMECDLHVERKKDVYSVIDSEIVELSRMVLEVRDAGTHDQLYPTDCTISWDTESFEADVKWLQENGVRGYMIVDLEGGEFARYRLTDERVEKAAGRCYFTGDREIESGPLMLKNEDMESLQASSLFMSNDDVAWLKENIEELEDIVKGRIMEEHFMSVLKEEVEIMFATRPEEEEEEV